jgi:competence protein ComEC
MVADRRKPDEGAFNIPDASSWLVLPTLSLLAGQAVAASGLALPAESGIVAAAPLALAFFARRRRLALLLFAAVIFFAVGYTRHRQLLYPEFPGDHIRALVPASTPVYLEGWLRQEPEKLPNRSRWLVRADTVWHPTGDQAITGDVLVNVRAVHREWHYGDRVRFWFQPAAPRDSGNPGGFNYASYLANRGIYATGFLVSDAGVELVSRRPSRIRGAVESLRRRIRGYIDQSFSGDTGPLLKALIIGDMGEISKETRAEFTAAGVNHVLSISGLHVAMLGLVVFAAIRYAGGFSTYVVLRWNLLKLATFCSFLAVVFYTALAGAMVPTLRSAIMIGVYELAVLLDREEEVLTSLTFAALLIALVWPGVVSDISFQLSFIAVLFIAWGTRRVRSWFAPRRSDELPQERSWWRAKLRHAALHLAVPVLATIGTGPLIAHYFGHLSLAGFISNPVIVPLVGFVIVPLGLLIALLSLTVPLAAPPLTWLAETLVSLSLWLVHQFSKLPLANIGVPAPNMLEVAGLYSLLFAFLLLRRHRYAVLAVVVIAAFLTADGIYWWRERWNRRELRVTHLNVGQGDAAVVELPGSKVLVIDAGGTATGEFDAGEAIIGPFLRARKILAVDYLLVSHPKIDHYGGMRSIVKEFGPLEFWSGAATGNAARFEDLEKTLEEGRVRRLTLHNQEPCRIFDKARLCILHPAREKAEHGSVVLRLEFGKTAFLFAGDIDARVERILQQRPGELRSAVIKVPRHGSAVGNSESFIAAVRPNFAVISGGGRVSARGEVEARYRNAGAEILRTNDDGAVIFESDGETIRYSTYKSGKKGEIRPE